MTVVPGQPADAQKPAVIGKPVTLLTQEIRFAATLTGGVSLAVWMGGIARELDILVHASDDRIEGRRSAPDPVQNAYRKLLDILDVTVCLDVLSGTSAGGINAGLLGLVNAQRKDLSSLRDIWLKAGSLATLLRDPNQSAPPSLLQGDGQLLCQLSNGIRGILGHTSGAPDPRPTDVFITTTLLSPELSRFTDDYGTSIDDADHHGLFHFRTQHLNSPDVVSALSLAARSSASFPGAFEPAFLPCGPNGTDSTHPDMDAYSTITAPHWAADGGLLINRPIGPLLDTIFDRAADREVRRALLYVVPTSGPPPQAAPDEPAKPLGLAGALLKDLAATQDQSIAADLTAIREHNDRVGSRLDTRLQLAALGARLSPPGLTDTTTWSAYRARQGESLAEPIATEIIRRLRAEPGLRPEWSAQDACGNDLHTALLAGAIAVITKDWPTGDPASGDEPGQTPSAAAQAASLGRPAFNAGKAVVLDLLRAGFTLAAQPDDRNDLAAAVANVHQAQGDMDMPDVTTVVRAAIKDPTQPTLEAATATITRAVTGAGDDHLEATLTASWKTLANAACAVAPTLRRLAAAAPLVPAARDGSWAQLRADARQQISTYLDYLGVDAQGATADSEAALLRVLDLIVSERALSPAGHRVDQRVELIQISADTRNELTAGSRQTAQTKLTGLQLHHFGAFYKASWRANDWMWGRLDGAGWLVHILLDPRRILSVCETAQPPVADGAEAFLATLEGAFGALGGDGAMGATRTELLQDLAFLNDAAAVIPGSLPRLSLAVAAALQLHIAKEELRSVEAQIRNGEDPISADERRWLGEYSAAGGQDAHIPKLLARCPVPDETLGAERDRATPLFLQTATKSAAVATSALTGFNKPPASLAPVFAIARTITRTAWVATDRTHGNRRMSLLAGVLLIILGIAALVSHSLLLGIPGLAALGAGMLVVAIATWRSVPRVVGAILALALVVLAAAPWLPWLNDHLRTWLQVTVIPFLFRDKWAWPIVFLLLLLPAVTSIIRLATHRPGPKERKPPPARQIPPAPKAAGGA
jgi:patatin-related protein